MTLREIVNEELICEGKGQERVLEYAKTKIKEIIDNNNTEIINSLGLKKNFNDNNINLNFLEKVGGNSYYELEINEKQIIKRQTLTNIETNIKNNFKIGFRESKNKTFNNIKTKIKNVVDNCNKLKINGIEITHDNINNIKYNTYHNGRTYYKIYLDKEENVIFDATSTSIISQLNNRLKNNGNGNTSTTSKADKEIEKHENKLVKDGATKSNNFEKEATNIVTKVPLGVIGNNRNGSTYSDSKKSDSKEDRGEKFSNGADWIITTPDGKIIKIEEKNFNPNNISEKSIGGKADPVNPVIKLIIFDKSNTKDNSFSLGLYNQGLYSKLLNELKIFTKENNSFIFHGDKEYEFSRKTFYKDEVTEQLKNNYNSINNNWVDDQFRQFINIDNKCNYILNNIQKNKTLAEKEIDSITTFNIFYKQFLKPMEEKGKLHIVNFNGAGQKKDFVLKLKEQNIKEPLVNKGDNDIKASVTTTDNWLKFIKSVIIGLKKIVESGAYSDNGLDRLALKEYNELLKEFLAKQQPRNFKTEISNKNITSKRNIHPIFNLNKKSNKNQEYGSVETKYFNY